LTPKLKPNTRGKLRIPGSRSLGDVMNCDNENFLDFVSKCLVWDPTKRIHPREALLHDWILEGLPLEIR
jgi:dual specificity tyrosine-phosphorylation-regulated kinase 2/3/4